MSTGLRFVTERTGDGVGQPILDDHDGEELIHVQTRVTIVLANRPPESSGTLYITNKRVEWLSDLDRGKGYSVDFVSISLHAVSRDPEAYPFPCIYAQIDTGSEGEESEESDSDSNEMDLSKITEMRLVLPDPSQLDVVFGIFCECAELNPGPIDGDVENEGEHNWVFSADQLESEDEAVEEFDWIDRIPVNAIGSNGNQDLAHSVLQLQINDQRFEDADEEMNGDDIVSRH